MELQETLQRFVNALRANHVIALFFKNSAVLSTFISEHVLNRLLGIPIQLHFDTDKRYYWNGNLDKRYIRH